ncbi:MAG: hypothetical protein SVR81_11375, partial [Chloroflexota bacterium]|nr:hypothetical protein [Chloroflexota bacterium]
MLSACGSVTSNATAPSPGPGTSQPAKGQTPSAPVEDSGYLYLRLGNVQGQFYHHFVRVPAACLVDQAACAEVEPVPTYPEGGIGFNRLHWSPDRSRAVLLDNNTDRLHIFDPQSATFSALLEEPAVGNDDLVWLSADELAFVRQNGEQTSSLMLLTWEGDTDPEIREIISFTGMAELLGEDLDGRLYFAENIIDHPAVDPSLKQQTVKTNILQVDPASGEWTKLWPEEDWLSMRPQAVTADGHWLVYGAAEASLWDLQTGETHPIGAGITWPIPSPDGRWLAAVFREEDLYSIRLLDLKTLTWESVVTLRSAPMLYWSPNSQYLVLARYYEPDLVSGPLIAIDPDTEDITTPLIDLQGYDWVDDVSWGW